MNLKKVVTRRNVPFVWKLYLLPIWNLQQPSLGLYLFSVPNQCLYSVCHADILWSVLRCHQSLPQNPHLHRQDCLCIQRETSTRDASSHLLNLWQRLPRYVARPGEPVHVDHVSVDTFNIKDRTYSDFC